MQLVSPAPQQQGGFGKSVSVDKMIAVGAPYEAVGSMAAAGHAYTFDSATGAVIQKLISPKAEFNGNFGMSVSTLGDTVVIGAPNETSGGHQGAGHAYVFNGKTGTLINTVASPAAQAQGWFGWNCSLNDQDLIAVGAPYEAVAGTDRAGRAYAFAASSGKLKGSFATPNPIWNGLFGATVVAGNNAIFVCAPNESSGALGGAGRVYVYDAATGAPQSKLVSPVPQSGGFFGCSLALYKNNMAVGESGSTVNGQFSAGRVHFYTNGALTTTLTNALPTPWAALGWSVVLGLWRNRLVVGGSEVPSATLGGFGLGRMLVFAAQPGFPLINKMTTGSTAMTTDLFGYASALGQKRIVIGQPTDTVANLTTAGRVYVFPE